jgi:phospholipid/cholesterol/gamma-HCH transport system permease protein
MVDGSISMENASLFRDELFGLIQSEPLRNIVADLSAVEYFDSAGVAALFDAHDKCRQMKNSMRIINAGPRIQALLDQGALGKDRAAGVLRPREQPGLLVQIGEGALKLFATATDILTFLGGSAEALARDIVHPKQVRWDNLWKLVERAGSDAVPIVTVLSFLMGAILAFQGAIQLRKFGANIFVADLVSVAICLEMGPLVTALIVAGRSGAAYAAQIGTMQVTEEIDALRVMAIDPVRYLVSPRIIAVALALPSLTIVADLIGALGGLVVAVISLDLTPASYINQVGRVLEVGDVVKGLIKSLVFGVEVAIIGCLKGFQVKGGAEGVGTAATSAVVTSIFIIVSTDAIFAVLYHYLRFV